MALMVFYTFDFGLIENDKAFKAFKFNCKRQIEMVNRIEW